MVARLIDAAAKASEGVSRMPELLSALEDEDAAVRYWGATGLKRLLGAVAAAAVVALLPLRASAAEFRTKPGALCAALAGAQSIVDANPSGRWVGGHSCPVAR